MNKKYCGDLPPKRIEPIPIYDYQDRQVKMFFLPVTLKKTKKTIEESIFGDYNPKKYIISMTKTEFGQYDVKLIKSKSWFKKFIDFLLRRINDKF